MLQMLYKCLIFIGLILFTYNIDIITRMRFLSLTSSQHQSALAHAVVIVHVFGAEVCSMDHQAALPACCPTVAL